MKNEWKLTSPKGGVFYGDSPLKCAQNEIKSRVSASIMLDNLFDSIEKDKDALLENILLSANYAGIESGDKISFLIDNEPCAAVVSFCERLLNLMYE